MSDYRVEKYEAKFYFIISSWFEKRKRPKVDQKELPSNGKIIFYQNNPVACGFIFKTDTAICSIGNMISDPEADLKIRGESVNILIDSLMILAKSLGFMGISCGAVSKKLISRYKSKGFKCYDQNVMILGRKI